jgi:hypothetical protein
MAKTLGFKGATRELASHGKLSTAKRMKKRKWKR